MTNPYLTNAKTVGFQHNIPEDVAYTIWIKNVHTRFGNEHSIAEHFSLRELFSKLYEKAFLNESV